MKIVCMLAVLILQIGTISAQIVNIESKRKQLATDTTGWFGSIDLGFNLNKNSSSVFSLTGNAQIDFLHDRSRWISLSNYQIIRADGAAFINTGFQHLRYNLSLTERITGEVFIQAQYNEKLHLRFRGLAGFGPRFRLVNDDKGTLFLGTHYMFQYEEISDTSVIYRDHRLSTYLSVNYRFNDIIGLQNTSYYQPLFTDLSIARLSSQTNIVINLTSRLAFNSRFNISIDNRLSENTKDVPIATYSFLNGLKWRF